MLADIKDLSIFYTDVNNAILQIKVAKKYLECLPNLDKPLTVEIKKKAKHRSLNSNNYVWILCQQIAEKMSINGAYLSKEDIYRICIKDCSNFIPMLVRDKDLPKITHAWSAKGIGWITELVGESPEKKGYTWMNFYHGSSTFTVEEMSRLIECLLDECQQLGINTETQEYVDSLLRDWGGKNER